MFEYKTEIIKVPYDVFNTKSKKAETARAEFDGFISQMASEGWELVCYSIAGAVELSRANILATFRKQTD